MWSETNPGTRVSANHRFHEMRREARKISTIALSENRNEHEKLLIFSGEPPGTRTQGPRLKSVKDRFLALAWFYEGFPVLSVGSAS